MAPTRKERILILAKTYPSPSARHVETSCVAGITQDGAMRRLYPIPFRDKLEHQLANRTRLFLMGNQHRFRDQWLIIGLIDPPKPPAQKSPQADLF